MGQASGGIRDGNLRNVTAGGLCRNRLSCPSVLTEDSRSIPARIGPEEERLAHKAEVLDFEADRRGRDQFEADRRGRDQSALNDSLQQQNILLRELHHRVRNNLQMIASMLVVGASEAKTPETRAALQDAADRVAAVGSVQQVIYSLGHVDNVDGAQVVRELTKSLQRVVLRDHELSYSLDSVSLDSDVAVPFALILNELLTNAAKYGRDGKARSRIAVGLKQHDGEIELSVKDEGPGFDLTETVRRASGIGLIRGLLRRIGGSFEVVNDHGARCIIHIKRRAEAGAGT
jgi:two-component sensor histidine kinase